MQKTWFNAENLWKCVFRVSRKVSFSYFPKVTLYHGGAPPSPKKKLLEFLWTMLQYPVQALCNI